MTKPAPKRSPESSVAKDLPSVPRARSASAARLASLSTIVCPQSASIVGKSGFMSSQNSLFRGERPFSSTGAGTPTTVRKTSAGWTAARSSASSTAARKVVRRTAPSWLSRAWVARARMVPRRSETTAVTVC